MSGMSKKAKTVAKKILSERFGWICHYCKIKLVPDGQLEKHSQKLPDGAFRLDPEYSLPELDHKIPISRGGTNSIDNLVLSCEKCNHTKNKKTEQEYIELRAI